MQGIAPKKLELLWDPKQVASYFGVTKTTVWRWVRKGQVFDPSAIIRLPHGQIRIPRSEVERVAGVKKEEIKQESME